MGTSWDAAPGERRVVDVRVDVHSCGSYAIRAIFIYFRRPIYQFVEKLQNGPQKSWRERPLHVTNLEDTCAMTPQKRHGRLAEISPKAGSTLGARARGRTQRRSPEKQTWRDPTVRQLLDCCIHKNTTQGIYLSDCGTGTGPRQCYWSTWNWNWTTPIPGKRKRAHKCKWQLATMYHWPFSFTNYKKLTHTSCAHSYVGVDNCNVSGFAVAIENHI